MSKDRKDTDDPRASDLCAVCLGSADNNGAPRWRHCAKPPHKCSVCDVCPGFQYGGRAQAIHRARWAEHVEHYVEKGHPREQVELAIKGE